MPLEVTCGHCQGDIVVESLGVTVACPLCGSHLEVPDPEAAIEVSAAETSPPVPPTEPAPVTETAAASAALAELAEPPPPTPHPAEEPVWQPPVDTAAGTDFTLAGETPVAGADALSETPTSIISTGREPVPDIVSPPLEPAAPVMRATEKPAAHSESAVPAAATVPWTWFILAASYASAVTLFLLYLLLTMGTRREHALESLPDLVPELRGGQVSMKVPKPQENVAPGHRLRLGESQRFGSLMVTPVKITRGPIQFEYAFKEGSPEREGSQPVLKLWLRFENVSTDQVFPPLDRTLVFKRIIKSKPHHVFTNNFLCTASERKENGKLHYLYELPEFSEFQIAGEDLDHPVKPGETWESFVPSEEGIADLTGDCVWRVQFRKGYNPQSRRGVTTLIDVLFKADEVQDEA